MAVALTVLAGLLADLAPEPEESVAWWLYVLIVVAVLAVVGVAVVLLLRKRRGRV